MTAEPVRVALVGLPAFLREIVAGALAAEGDVTVVGELRETRDAAGLGADVVVLPDESVDPDSIEAPPGASLIGISADGRQAYAYARGRRVLLGGLSPESLREAVRSAGGDG